MNGTPAPPATVIVRDYIARSSRLRGRGAKKKKKNARTGR